MVYVHVCMVMCTFAIRPEVSINCLPQPHLIFFETGLFTEFDAY